MRSDRCDSVTGVTVTGVQTHSQLQRPSQRHNLSPCPLADVGTLAPPRRLRWFPATPSMSQYGWCTMAPLQALPPPPSPPFLVAPGNRSVYLE